LLSGRLWLALLGTVLVLLIDWTRHAIIRPEIFGNLCFALLLWMVVQGQPWRSRWLAPRAALAGDRLSWSVWIGVPLLFAFWANLHGSFMTGLVLLGCHALGRAIQVAWRTRRFAAVLSDRWVRRWALLTELALLATLINPAGIDLLIETVRFGANPNLRDVLEWFPLKANTAEGILFGVSLIALIALVRFSRRRMTPTDALLLLAFGLAVGPTVRMIGWWAPIFTLVMLPHIAGLWQRIARRTSRPEQSRTGESAARPPETPARLTPASFLPSLLCVLTIWTAFSLSPISQPLLGSKPREPQRIHGRGTPLAVTAWLREHPPQGLVFGPQWWGDWLAWDGPPELQVFMTTHIHLAPQRVWRDYMRIARAEQGWQQALDRYGVAVLVIDKELQTGLAREARRSGTWRIALEDERAMVLLRDAK
jgi:hypothetical protein